MDERYDIDNIYTYHSPTPEQVERYATIRSTAKSAAQTILDLCPVSRERDEALRAIEACVMWANAAIARHE